MVKTKERTILRGSQKFFNNAGKYPRFSWKYSRSLGWKLAYSIAMGKIRKGTQFLAKDNVSMAFALDRAGDALSAGPWLPALSASLQNALKCFLDTSPSL